MESVLFKKQAKGLGHGMHIWRKRYFVYDLDNDIINYYDDQNEPSPIPRGVIPLVNVQQIRWFPGKKGGKRFDITVEYQHQPQDEDIAQGETRVLALMAPSRALAKQWVQFLTNLLNSKRAVEDHAKVATRSSVFAARQEYTSDSSFFINTSSSSSPNAVIVFPGNDRTRSVSIASTAEDSGNKMSRNTSVNNLTDMASDATEKNASAVEIRSVANGKSLLAISSKKLVHMQNNSHAYNQIYNSMTSSRRHSKFTSPTINIFHYQQVYATSSGKGENQRVFIKRYGDSLVGSVNEYSALAKFKSFGLTKAIKKIFMLNRKLFPSADENPDGDEAKREASFSMSSSFCKSTSESPSDEADHAEDLSENNEKSHGEEDSQRKSQHFKNVNLYTSFSGFGSISHFYSLIKPLDGSANNWNIFLKCRNVEEKMRDESCTMHYISIWKNYRNFEKCFSSADFVLWMFDSSLVSNFKEGKELATQLIDLKFIRPLVGNTFVISHSDYYTFTSRSERDAVLKEPEFLANMSFWIYLMRDRTKGVKLRTIKTGLRSRHNRFTGKEVQKWLINSKAVSDPDEAFEYIRILLKKGILWAIQGEELQKGKEDSLILQFNRDLCEFEEETMLRKICLSTQFRAFLSSIGSDRDLLEILLKEHVRFQSSDANAKMLKITISGSDANKKSETEKSLRSSVMDPTKSFSESQSVHHAVDDAVSARLPIKSLTVGKKSGKNASKSLWKTPSSSQYGHSNSELLPMPMTPSHHNSDSVFNRFQTLKSISAAFRFGRNKSENEEFEIKDDDLRDSDEDSEEKNTEEANESNMKKARRRKHSRSRSISKSKSKSAVIENLESEKFTALSPKNVFDSKKIPLEDVKYLTNVLYKILVYYTVDFGDKLKETFKSNDSDAHSRSLDMFWEVLKIQSLKSHLCYDSAHCSECAQIDLILCKWISDNCGGEKFTAAVKESLIALLIDNVWSPIKAIPFNQKVIRPGLWKSLFLSLQGSSVSIRNSTFKDINALLLNRCDNSIEFSQFRDWQLQIVPYLFPCFDEIQKNTALALNMISIVHVHCFNASKNFADQLCNTLHFIRSHEIEHLRHTGNRLTPEDRVNRGKYPLNRFDSLLVVRIFLETICSKLEDKASSVFGTGPDQLLLSWNNLLQLCHVISLYLFNTPKWNHFLIEDYHSSSVDWAEILKASHQSSLYKYRLHRVVNVDGSSSWSQDLSLILKVYKLLCSIKLAKLDVEFEMQESMNSKQKEFLVECKKWYEFYKDAVQFLYFIRDFEPIFNWNKHQMYILCKDFMTKEASKRPEWISKLCLKPHNKQQ